MDGGARIAVHFHPDTGMDGRSALLQMLADGSYLSQFATGTSNGGLAGQGRGDRWLWEHRIFGGAYDDVDALDRPVYGALQVDRDPHGPAPRFGSAYLRLRVSCLSRATFAYPDSVFQPASFGTAEQMGLLAVMAGKQMADPLDRYIEAHVHGGVEVPADAEVLVLDPCYRGSELEAEARVAGLTVQWHPGYVLETDGLMAHVDYRGEEVAALGRRLAVDGRITPRILGQARGRREMDPQLLKKLWHCVAAFGRATSAYEDPDGA